WSWVVYGFWDWFCGRRQKRVSLRSGPPLSDGFSRVETVRMGAFIAIAAISRVEVVESGRRRRWMPSARYSWSGSPLMFWNGSTAIDGLSGSVSTVGERWLPGRAMGNSSLARPRSFGRHLQALL